MCYYTWTCWAPCASPFLTFSFSVFPVGFRSHITLSSFHVSFGVLFSLSVALRFKTFLRMPLWIYIPTTLVAAFLFGWFSLHHPIELSISVWNKGTFLNSTVDRLNKMMDPSIEAYETFRLEPKVNLAKRPTLNCFHFVFRFWYFYRNRSKYNLMQ